MKQLEHVTFGAGIFNHKANLRDDPAQLTALMNASGACILPLWNGKPLLRTDGSPSLQFVAATDPVLRHAQGDPIFLGLHANDPVFTADVSAWKPGPAPTAPPPETVFDPALQPLPGTDAAFGELRGVMAALPPVHAEIAATARALTSWHVSHRFCAACGAKSNIAMAGWQRTCPTCSTHHFPRTDPVVIMLVTHGNSLLVGRSPGWPDQMYSLLAGFVEPGETIEAATRREVFEECGVECGAVRYLASQPWPFPSSLMIGCQTQALGRDLTLDPVEIEDAFWISREEMLAVFAGTHDRMLPPRAGAIATYLLRNWLADRVD